MQWSVKILVIAAVMCVSCSRGGGNHDSAEQDGLNPDRWRPTSDAIAAAKRDKKAPLIVARATQPRASDYDLNPRSVSRAQDKRSADLTPNEQTEDDPM